MLNTNKRSGLIDTNKDYYSKLFENWNTLRTEKFNIKRSHQRFSSYSKARKSLSHFAKKMTNDMKIKCNNYCYILCHNIKVSLVACDNIDTLKLLHGKKV